MADTVNVKPFFYRQQFKFLYPVSFDSYVVIVTIEESSVILTLPKHMYM